MIMEGNIQDKPVQVQDNISLETWRRLYHLGTQVRNMEPWLWMEETDIFGVQDTESNTTVFVSVMGLLGEYHAIALYLGAKAVTQFWLMQNTPDTQRVADMLFDIPQIHAAFGKKIELMPEEKRITRELGLTFKGVNAWPYFRSYRPGYFPWMIDAEEARLLMLVLEQILVVAPRVKDDRRLVARKPDTCTYLIRVPAKDATTAVWRDEFRECPPPATNFQIKVPNDLMSAVRSMPPNNLTFELDVAPAHIPVGKKGERPQMPYMMIAADSESLFVLGVELLGVELALEDMWAQVPAKFLEMVRRNGMRPKTIAIRTHWVFMVMRDVCKELGITVKHDPELRALEAARYDLEKFGRR